MERELNFLRQTRRNILASVENLSVEQLNKIPSGFNNNIAWQLGHIAITHQLLCYKLSDLDGYASAEQIAKFRKGSSPESFIDRSEIEWIKTALIDWINAFETDIKNSIFKEYKEYPTSYGITLTSFEDAASFNTIHEGVHFGNILALRKLL